MALRRLRGSCNDGKTCPTLFQTDRGTVVGQGWTVVDPETLSHVGPLPAGESLVEIPVELVAEVLGHAAERR